MLATEQIIDTVTKNPGINITKLRHTIVFDCDTGQQRVNEYAFIGSYWILVNKNEIQVDDDGRVYLVVQSPSNG